MGKARVTSNGGSNNPNHNLEETKKITIIFQFNTGTTMGLNPIVTQEQYDQSIHKNSMTETTI